MALSALASPQTQPSAPALPSNGIMDASGQYLIVPPGTQLSPGGSTPAMLAVFPDGKQTIVPATTWPAYYRVGGDNGAFQDFDQSGQPLKTAPGAPPFSLQAGTKLYDPTTGALAGEVSSGLPGNASQAFFEAALAVAGGAAAGAYGLGGAAAGGTAADAEAGAYAAGGQALGAGAADAGATAGGYDLTGNLANLAANPANIQVAGDATGIGAVGGGAGGATDAATLAGDIGGAAFPVDAATTASQWGSLGALAPAAAAPAAAGGGGGATDPVTQAYIDNGAIESNGTLGTNTGLSNATLNPANYTGAAGATPGTALSRILAGTGTAADYASVGLQALPGVLGAIGSSEQASALSNLAQQQFAVGAPSRARYEASMTPGFDPTTIPGYSGALSSTSQAVLSKLSATGGNPYGNPGGLISANQQIINGTALPAVENYQNQNAATGGYGAFNTAANGTAQSAIGAQGGVLSALGSAASSVVNPPQTLADLLKQYGLGSSASNNGTMANNASSLT